MKISRIYTNSKPFQHVAFGDGLAVVVGRVSNKEDYESNTHNLGKSLLGQVIDFLLLSRIPPEHFLLKNISIFADYTFFMEIKLNHGGYITIKRSVADHNKVSIAVHEEPIDASLDEIEWDYSDLSLGAATKDKNKRANDILKQLLNFNVCKDYSIRQSSSYFFRQQSDYDEVFRIKSFGPKDSNWKPFVFQLLGLNGANLHSYYENRDKIDEARKAKNILRSSEFTDSETKASLQEQINILKNEQRIAQKAFDDFSFAAQEKKVNKSLVKSTEKQISKLNIDAYRINLDIQRLESSLSNYIPFSQQDIIDIYDSVSIDLPEALCNSIDSLIDFNKRLFRDRESLIRNRLTELSKDIEIINTKLEDLNKLRSQILSSLREEDTFKKFKEYQRLIITSEEKISHLTKQISSIDITSSIDAKISSFKQRVQTISEGIKKEIYLGSVRHAKISKLFETFLKEILNENGRIFVEQNSKGNIDFKHSITNKEGSDTSKSQGFSYKKLLCVVFDLAIAAAYSDCSFYRSLYHDGVWESIDMRLRKRHIECIRKICKEYNIQYILTVIEHDIPPTDDGSPFFSEDEIALVLSDASDNSGRLFKTAF